MYEVVNKGGTIVKISKFSQPLSEYVNQIYEVKGIPYNNCERLFPRNGVEITFNLGEPFQIWSASNGNYRTVKNCIIIGNRTGYFDYKAFPEVHLCSIQFTLNGFFKLLNIGQNGFGDSYNETESVFSKSSNFLLEELRSKNSIQERFDFLNKWLEERFRNKIDRGHYVVKYLMDKIQSDPTVRIKDLEKESGFSRKHLFTCFKNETGLSPKQFQRAIRFNCIIKNLHCNPDWMDISFELGYYDQSHFIREVQHFAGVNPSQLLKSPIPIVAGVLPVIRDWR